MKLVGSILDLDRHQLSQACVKNEGWLLSLEENKEDGHEDLNYQGARHELRGDEPPLILEEQLA